jgi:hypothetical protein
MSGGKCSLNTVKRDATALFVINIILPLSAIRLFGAANSSSELFMRILAFVLSELP